MTTKPLPAPYRYSVYFAPPPQSAWWQAGSQWLGRCAAGNAVLAMPAIKGMSEDEWQSARAAPRRYGWHATLKAPFILAPDTSVNLLATTLSTLAQSMQAFDMPLMQVVLMDDFLALVPQVESEKANTVAARCVVELQSLAATLSESELKRRRQAGLSAEQDAMLLRWGYPFVLEHYRLHFSLTGSLKNFSQHQIENLLAAAQDWFAVLPPCRLDSLALFVEPSPGADFMLQEHFFLTP
jgi:hypothetical protein